MTMIQGQAAPSAELIRQVGKLTNERLLKLREEVEQILKGLDGYWLGSALPGEAGAERERLQRSLKEISAAIEQEYGWRVLNGYKSRASLVVAELEAKAGEALIIPFSPRPRGHGEEGPTAHDWLICLGGGGGQPTILRDGIPIQLPEGETLERIRLSICEQMSEADHYREVYVSLDLTQAGLRALVGKQEERKKEGGQS